MFNIFSPEFFSNIVAVGAIVVAVIYIFSRIRRQDLDILRTSNKDLRDSINDKTAEIKNLTDNLKALEMQVATMEVKIDILEKQNGDLSKLVKEALILYFKTNPNVADTMKEK